LQAVHRQHNTAADAAGLSPRGCGCRAACAQLPEGPGASTSRVADRGWCFGTVAWFKSLCVWAALAPMRAGLGSPHWGTGLAAVVRRLRPRCPEWAARPTTVVSSGVLVGLGGVCVATPWLVREPRGWGFRGCGGGGWGAAVWWAASWAQARGQLATETCTPGQCQWHAAARMPFKPDTASFRAVRCVVGGKEANSPALTWRLQATCATRCK
jgi:hypothetical protein